MFDCVEGKMSEHQYGARDLQDLSFHIDHYINQLNSRVKILTNNGESSSSVPPHFILQLRVRVQLLFLLRVPIFRWIRISMSRFSSISLLVLVIIFNTNMESMIISVWIQIISIRFNMFHS